MRGQLCLLLALGICLATNLHGADGQLQLRLQGSNAFIRVEGDRDDDWRFQISTDLITWSNAPALGTLLGAGTNGPWRNAGAAIDGRRLYRAVKTAGLFDPTVMRTISVTFAQSNWQSLLASGRTTGSNVLGNLTLDNGATNLGIGARYKGNTSYTQSGVKKSVNLEMDFTNAAARLMGFKTVNLNNAFGDETLLREPLYFNVMQNYTVCPRGSLAKFYINGDYWGVYSFVEQENNDMVKDWFPSDSGDRWKAPNVGAGGGGFASARSALSYLGPNVASYQSAYELKTQNSTNPWAFLIHTVDVLNNTPTNLLREAVEEVLAVDRWLWFLAIENIFADDDSYFHKGADYGFYYEPESGRMHPIEHDGNEAFTAADVSISPLEGTFQTNRPVIGRLLAINELRQRYFAHMRTVLQEIYNPAVMTPLINQYSAMSVADIMADPKKSFGMTAYTNDLVALKTFVTNRHSFLTNHAEVRRVPPVIQSVVGPAVEPNPTQAPSIAAQVVAGGTNGVGSVWLYHRGRSYGRFATAQMFDDGNHADGAAGDGIFGAATTNYPAGTKVRYYVEARSLHGGEAASYAPPRAEQETFSYRVAVPFATNTPVLINELMALNTVTLADPQGEYDDWIELINITGHEVDLSGHYLSDEPNNPRKWAFPANTRIAAEGYLIVWADEDSAAASGLHTSFRLAAEGETIFLTDTDENHNAVLDFVTFGTQQSDRSFGRAASDPEVLQIMEPTPLQANR